MSTDDRDEQLRKVPPLDPFPSSSWPEGVRGISIGEVDGIGVNAKGELYWRGKPVEIRRPLDLSRAKRSALSSWQPLP